ncbi:MAG: hypothetical protein DSY85_03235, partial [Marinomonas sp.]
YTPPSTGALYEDVTIDTSVVTTTITDNGGTESTPLDPNNPSDGPEGNVESVQIKLIALDANGDPMLDSNNHYTFANTVPEGGDANYMAIAFAPTETVFSPDTKLANQVGTVNITFANEGATGANTQSAQDGTEDFNNTAQTSVTLGTVISTAVYDDYVRDGGEQFTVIITDKSYTPPSTGALYEDVTIDTTVVTTTITDNPAQDTENPGTPTEPTDPEDPTDTPSYGTDDSVYVRILDNDVASEGDVLTHKVQLVDASGNAVTVPTGETITITLTYAGTNTLTDTDSAAEAGDYTAIKTVTILGGTSETSFTNTAVDDYYSEGIEEYTVTVATAAQANASFENVAIDTNQNSVTGQITDNPAQDTGKPGTPTEPTDPDNPSDIPSYDTDDSVYVRILDSDVTSEGDKLTHKVQLVDASGNAVTVPTGETITITLTYAGTKTLIDTDSAAEAGDYIATTTVTILGGTSETSFTNTAVDDYFAEGIEEYTVTVATAAQANASFENVAIDVNQNSVTGQITDNLAKINQPDDSTSSDDPTNGSYDQDDTIYAVIEGPTQVKEGDSTTVYTVKLVDKDGNPVTVTTDTDITVTYKNVTTEDDDTQYSDGETITVTIPNNESSKTFTVETVDDPYKDNGEKFDLTITDIEATGEFENIAIGDINGNYSYHTNFG